MKQPSSVAKKKYILLQKVRSNSYYVAVKVTTCTKYIFIYIKFQKESKMTQA